LIFTSRAFRSSRRTAAQYQHQRQQHRQRGGSGDGRRQPAGEIFARSYTGASLRRQAHAFADDIVFAITGKKGIGQTKIAFKAQATGRRGEIYVSDFDGHNAQAVTHDNAIVAAPAWVPGRLALYYTSYQPGNPDIFYHNLSTGQRRIIAGFPA
jgi:TolB protein